jgi:hypothetical protein
MSTTLAYNESDLKQIVERLPEAARVSFAAACAQRMFSAYVRYAAKTGKGDSDPLAGILARLWADLIDEPMLNPEVDDNIARCMELMDRNEEQPWIPELPAADSAASAVAYALRCRKNYLAQEACWAASMAYEALDEYVINQEGIDTNAPGGEARVLAHALVQSELGRQRRDLDDLLAGAITIAQLRTRAITESATFLP